MILTPDWPAPPAVRAAFTLRMGGVSAAPYDSLNLGARVGDSPEAVEENRRRIREQLRLPDDPVWLEQVHGTAVLNLDEYNTTPTLPRADAAVAQSAGRVCAVQVADCMPVLFAARDGSAVGVAHAGWRGLSAGVLESTLRGLDAQVSQLLAWMGPAIGAAHFEVGDDVRAAFMAEDVGAAGAFVANPRGRWQCNLYALARRRLAALGVSEIYGGGWCTYADAERFFSFRRDGVCGRMAALIWIEPGRT
ncbi:MAG: peptidoglycan editing factor PgeF [Steroidobacteraceae bacterium]